MFLLTLKCSGLLEGVGTDTPATAAAVQETPCGAQPFVSTSHMLLLSSNITALAAQASAVVEEDQRETDAVAFKNRLVGYDRNAAQRTKVIDDQSDYFEIDSNTWLSQQVCLKHRHAQAQYLLPCEDMPALRLLFTWAS